MLIPINTNYDALMNGLDSLISGLAEWTPFAVARASEDAPDTQEDADKVTSKAVATGRPRLTQIPQVIWNLIGAFSCSTVPEYLAFSLTCKSFQKHRGEIFSGNNTLANVFFNRFGGLRRDITPSPGCFFGTIPAAERVFIQTHGPSLRSISCTSRRDPQVTLDIVTTFKNLQTLDFYSLGATDAEKEGASSFCKLAELPLCELTIEGEGTKRVRITDIAGISTLRTLTLATGQIIDPKTEIGLLKRLTSLNLSGSMYGGGARIGDPIAPFLPPMSELRTLSLASTHITDPGLVSVGKITTLTSLSLANCREFSDRGIASLDGLVHLREVSLANTVVTNQAIVHLGTRKLTKLNISTCTSISGGFLGALQHIACLEELALANPFTGVVVKAEEALKGIEKATNLTNLDISYINEIGGTSWKNLLYGSPLSNIAKLPKLRVLNLSYTGMKDDGLAEVAKMRTLSSLDLGSLPITDRGVALITRLPLQELRLSFTPITDIGVATVAQITSLTSLQLGCEGITDKGLESLVRLEHLSYLYIGQCKALTQPAVAKLQRSLPFCHIISDFTRYRG